MTLATDIAAVLLRGVDALNHQTSSAQRGFQSDEERKIALRHLMLTVETAVKLADIAHVETLAQHKASGAGVQSIKAETESTNGEEEKIKEEAGRGVQPAKRKAGTLVVVESGRGTVKKGDIGKEVERTIQESQDIKKALEKHGSDVDKAVHDMKELKAELEKLRTQKLESETEARKSAAEIEKLRRGIDSLSSYLGISVMQ